MRPLLLLLLAAGCKRDFDPPEDPPHDAFEHGYGHGRGLETPFLCMESNGRFLSTCAEDGVRPERALLSCDASGCHGDYDYQPGTPRESRHLLGSEGPSCFTCHNREWHLDVSGRERVED